MEKHMRNSVRSFMQRHYKLLPTLAAVLVLGTVYLGLNYFNQFRQSYVDVGLAFEASIPLIPVAVLIYLTVYFVYAAPLLFVFNVQKYKRVIAAYMFVALVSGLVFLLAPTRMPWEPFVANGFVDHLVPFLRAMDKPHNLFPSLHVSLAFLATFVVASENKRWGYGLAIASTLIAFSTLFAKQHYVLDLLAGLLLGLFAYVFFVRQ